MPKKSNSYKQPNSIEVTPSKFQDTTKIHPFNKVEDDSEQRQQDIKEPSALTSIDVEDLAKVDKNNSCQSPQIAHDKTCKASKQQQVVSMQPLRKTHVQSTLGIPRLSTQKQPGNIDLSDNNQDLGFKLPISGSISINILSPVRKSRLVPIESTPIDSRNPPPFNVKSSINRLDTNQSSSTLHTCTSDSTFHTKDGSHTKLTEQPELNESIPFPDNSPEQPSTTNPSIHNLDTSTTHTKCSPKFDQPVLSIDSEHADDSTPSPCINLGDNRNPNEEFPPGFELGFEF
ncbi:hypothetical protein Salat_1149700 [Sesamum alatum]|uniref:Uncharacterized protein n=1 Tax=Sesamum alatum TaxID=300844 RepID=A0AAE1YDZ0_9LAMI|nr:hypothetical protein Salat_1149700 [Sesamum alatum]